MAASVREEEKASENRKKQPIVPIEDRLFYSG